jgi:outer membrane lipoprotein-sorting protein
MPPPHEQFIGFTNFNGTVTIGGQPAPNGTFLEAHVLWYRTKPAKVFEGSYTVIMVSPNDWALHGQTITFHYGNLQAEETATYNASTLQAVTLNLTFP